MDINQEDGDCEMKQSILERAALATADLTQPVRLIKGETGGYILQTAKGENTPAKVTEQSEEEISQYFEEIMTVLDREVTRTENEDEMPVDMLTAPQWFGPFRHQGAFYCLQDLSLQLDPNRSKTILEPIYKILTAPSPDCEFRSKRVQALKSLLDAKCSQNLSCVYRLRYPQVGKAGPVALCPVVLTMLTRGVTVSAANHMTIEEILLAVMDVLLPVVGKDNCKRHEPQSNFPELSSTSFSTDMCICCLLCKQTRSYVDASSEVAYQEDKDGLLSATTFLGVMKTDMGKLGCVKTEVDYFSPVVNVHDQGRCYLADKTPFPEYTLVNRKVGGDWIWLVQRANRLTEHVQADRCRISKVVD